MKKKEYNKVEINVVELVEAVRKRPAMYAGSTRLNGFNRLLKLIIETAFVSTQSNSFEIFFDKKMGVIIKFHNIQKPIIDSVNENISIRGFELAVLNFLSEKYEFTLFDKDKNILLHQVYKKGLSQKGKVQNQEYLADSLEIKFKLDNTIWDFEKINYYFIADKIRDSAFLFKKNIFRINYLVNNEKCKIIYHFENGLLDQIELEEYKGWGNFLFRTWEETKLSNLSLEVAFAFREYQMDEPLIKSYVNYIYTHEGGTHVKGLLKGLTKALTAFCEKHKPTDEVFEFSAESLRKHLVASIHVQLKQPLFQGPTKGKLVNPEVINPIADFVAEVFLQKLENDVQSAESLISRFKVWG